MATSANYARLGFFIVLASALVVGAIVWFGGMGGKQYEYLVETYFSDPVSGLDIGSAVNFRGVKVGSVKRISFVGNDYRGACDSSDEQTIRVVLALNRRLVGIDSDDNADAMIDSMVAKGLHTTVAANGVTGLSRIEVNFSKGKIIDRPISWKPRYRCIPPAPSILQSAADSLVRVLDQLNRMDLVSLWTNAVNVAGAAASAFDAAASALDANRGSLAETIGNLRRGKLARVQPRHQGQPLGAATRAPLRTVTGDQKMIVHLHGTLVSKSPASAVVECGGVGYEAKIPLSTYERLPASGEKVMLLTYHEVREDAQLLYGFATEGERELFARLVSVSGVGPKIAIALISGFSAGEISLAIADGDAKRLATVKGVGKKTAERIVVELRDKVDAVSALALGRAAPGDAARSAMLRDAMLTLGALGYADDAARRMVEKALDAGGDVADTETLVKLALRG